MLAVAAAPARAATPPICFDSSSPSATIDKRVAQSAAQAMGVAVRIEPYDGSTGVSERYFRFLAHSHCSLVMGFPVDSLNPDPPAGLQLTHSYLQTGYVLAALNRRATLASIPPRTSVAVGSSTVPNFYLVGALGPARPLVSDVYLSQAEAVAALVAHRDPVAMLWGPSVVQYRMRHPGAAHIVVAPLPIPHAHWGIAALYDRSQAAFAGRFNAAVATLRAKGTLHQISSAAGLEAM